MALALASLVAIAGPKKSRFQGPPLPMAFVMNSARIKIITSRAIYTTGSYHASLRPYPLVHVVFLVQCTLYSTTVQCTVQYTQSTYFLPLWFAASKQRCFSPLVSLVNEINLFKYQVF
jgi:hypothetical protein